MLDRKPHRCPLHGQGMGTASGMSEEGACVWGLVPRGAGRRGEETEQACYFLLLSPLGCGLPCLAESAESPEDS